MQYDRDKAIEAVGGSQFELALIAAHRARQLKQGSPARVETSDREGLTALIEIQEKLYTKQEWLDELSGKKSVEEIDHDESI